jgi:hypothetical protein
MHSKLVTSLLHHPVCWLCRYANYPDAVTTSDLTTAPSCLLVMSSGGVSCRSYVAVFEFIILASSYTSLLSIIFVPLSEDAAVFLLPFHLT